MGFVGNYAPCGLSPQMYNMPVIQKKLLDTSTYLGADVSATSMDDERS